MKFVRNFICLLSVAGLFLMMGCSNSVVDSTDISINFNISALKSKTSKVMQNAGSIRALSETESSEVIEAWNTAKLSVALYEVKNAENIPSDYESFDKSLYKEISFSSCYADESGNMTVTLSAVPIGIKAIIVAEISDEQADIQSVEFAGLSNVFEVSDGTNVVELELKSTQKEPVIQNFTLKFILSNQTEKELTDIQSGTVINITESVKLDGYNVKFYEDANYSKQITDTEIVVNSDVIIYVELEAITYSITYKLNDGIWADGFDYEETYTIESAVDFRLPTSEHLTKEGFVFEYWYDNAECTGTAIKNLAGKTGDLTLYARWRNANQVATVQFSEQAGGVDAGTNIALTCETENATIYYNFENKEFSDNWQDEAWQLYTSDATATSEGITVFANDSTNPVTIYAIAVCNGMENSAVASITYTLNEYTINFDANGGTLGTNVTSSITVKSGNKVSLLGYIATRTGYTFKGWYEVKNPDFTTSGDVREFIPSRDNTTNKSKTFYAVWEPITYTVVFDGNGADASSSMASQNFKYDESKALSQNTFVRTGYTFIGWNTNADGTGTTYADKAVVSNLTYTDGERFTLYAQWQPNTASITVTLPTYTDISGLSEPEKNVNNVVFTASGYNSYAWYVNGDKQTDATSSSFTFNTSSEAGGIYTIMLVVTNSSGSYSAEWQITVEK